MANVKGSALASRVLWVQLEHGEAGYQAPARPGLAGAAADRSRWASTRRTWYPFEQFVELNVVLDRLFGKGDLGLIRELGRYGADANLKTIYRLFYKVGTVHWILGRAVRLWSAHYDSGYLEVATRGPKAAVLRIRGFATPHPVHCLVGAGLGRALDRAVGRQAAGHRQRPQCRTRGDELCQLEVTWD